MTEEKKNLLLKCLYLIFKLAENDIKQIKCNKRSQFPFFFFVKKKTTKIKMSVEWKIITFLDLMIGFHFIYNEGMHAWVLKYIFSLLNLKFNRPLLLCFFVIIQLWCKLKLIILEIRLKMIENYKVVRKSGYLYPMEKLIVNEIKLRICIGYLHWPSIYGQIGMEIPPFS